jgi:O-antigen ligase
MLVLSETRTALIGLAIGLPLASVTLALTSSRARRAIAVTAASAVLAVLAVPQLLAAYVQRDQSDAALSNLSGRQKVWDALLAQERTPLEQILGTGLSGKTYNGQAIDSTWMSSYNELGLVGVALVAAILLSLLVLVAVRPPSPARRCALFLVIYCAVASYTESGLSDASPYLLHLAVAASLLQRPETVADTSDTDEHQHEEADS